MKTKLRLLSTILVVACTSSSIFISCKKDNTGQSTDIKNIYDLSVDPAFEFQTTKDVGIQVTMLDNNNGPVAGMRVDIYTAFPDSGGKRILSGITDAHGLFKCDYKIAAYVKTLAVGTDAIGFVNMQTVPVHNGLLQCTLGGLQQVSTTKIAGGHAFKSTNSKFVSMGAFNSLGVPQNLEPKNDVIDASMLNDINATLPERVTLPTSHPQYFAATNQQNLVINEACNVWVTFVSEGAGYRNVLGYYIYKTGNAPVSVDQIDTVHIIFPNASFAGSGGGLNAGNKVHIGQFSKGTEIGWVLISDGYQGSVTKGNWIFYSDQKLNPEANSTLKQHFVLCNDIGRGKFLLGVEDIKRDSNSDNDFNDAVFYVTADPIQAIDVSHVPMPDYTQADKDKDGIPDNFDDYPADATKAFNNYFPSEKNFGTLAFEDLWPSKGDYDFNDMIIDYQFNQVTNGQNKVVGVEGKLVLRAMGAGFQNGFGIQLPIDPKLVSAFNGSRITGNNIELLANGTEAGQSKATLILFDNGFKVLPHIAGTQVGVNTTIGEPYQVPDTMRINISFASAVTLSQLGVPPYNPFIFTNLDRSHEVHLINNPPTDKADLKLFGTDQDDSNPASGRYYVTRNNLPWGLNTVEKFSYPAEKIPVNEAFLKFIPWSISGGSDYPDWFLEKTDYRNANKLYH